MRIPFGCSPAGAGSCRRQPTEGAALKRKEGIRRSRCESVSRPRIRPSCRAARMDASAHQRQPSLSTGRAGVLCGTARGRSRPACCGNCEARGHRFWVWLELQRTHGRPTANRVWRRRKTGLPDGDDPGVTVECPGSGRDMIMGDTNVFENKSIEACEDCLSLPLDFSFKVVGKPNP